MIHSRRLIISSKTTKEVVSKLYNASVSLHETLKHTKEASLIL